MSSQQFQLNSYLIGVFTVMLSGNQQPWLTRSSDQIQLLVLVKATLQGTSSTLLQGQASFSAIADDGIYFSNLGLEASLTMSLVVYLSSVRQTSDADVPEGDSSEQRSR